MATNNTQCGCEVHDHMGEISHFNRQWMVPLVDIKEEPEWIDTGEPEFVSVGLKRIATGENKKLYRLKQIATELPVCHEKGDYTGLIIKAHEFDQKAEADPRNAVAWHTAAADLRARIDHMKANGA